MAGNYGATVVAAVCSCIALSCGNHSDESTGTAQQAAITKKFGVHSGVSYQNGWLTPLAGSDTFVSRMGTELSSGATFSYWYSLQNKQYYWHDTGDQAANSLEDVDMFLGFTHGGIDGTSRAVWGMWENNVFAKSDSMRLGDEALGLSIFATVSCATMKLDGSTWNRWKHIFKGGLRAALGSHDLFAWGSAEEDVGKVFAQYLNAGSTLKASWKAGWDLTAYNNQDAMVMFTGNSTTDCTSRRDNMKWSNFTSYTRRQDGSITTWCEWHWDDI